MAIVTLPQLGESVVEGTVTRHLVKAGDHVALDAPLFEVSTDKVDTEVPSPVAGVVVRWLVAEGDTVAVGAEIVEVSDSSDAAAPAPVPATAEPAPAPAPTPTPAPAPAPAAAEPAPAPAPTPTPAPAPAPAPPAPTPAPIPAAPSPAPKTAPVMAKHEAPAAHGIVANSLRFEIENPPLHPDPIAFIAFCALRAAERSGLRQPTLAVAVSISGREVFVSVPNAAEWRLDRLARDISNAASTDLTPDRLEATTVAVSTGVFERAVLASPLHVHVTTPKPTVVVAMGGTSVRDVSVVTVSSTGHAVEIERFAAELQQILTSRPDHL